MSVSQSSCVVRELWSESGARAELVHDDAGHERFAVRDGSDRLLFEYDATAGRGSLVMPEGDLSIAAPKGNIQLVAGKSVRCVSAGAVSLDSATGVDLRVRGGGRPSRIRVRPNHIGLTTPELDMEADRAQVAVGHLRVAGRHIDAVFDRAHAVVDDIETVATRVLTRATELYERVEKLRDVRAGRMRSLVAGALEMSGRTTRLSADADMRVTGDKIHLTGAGS